MKYNDTFGAIASLSGALHVLQNADKRQPGPLAFADHFFGDLNEAFESDKNPRVLVKQLLEKGAGKTSIFPALYLACGTEDALLEPNREFRDFLRNNGIAVTYEEGPGGHEWDFWDSYIRRVLDWLPLEDGKAGINSGNVHN